DLHLDVDHLVAGINTSANRLFDPVDDRGDIFPRNRPAHNLVFDLDTFALFIRLNLDQGVAILTATAGLPDELALAVGGFGDGFAIGNLRRARARVHFEFPKQTVADDFQVQLAHARDDELAGLLVGEAAESRVFFRQTLEPFPHFVAVGPRLGFNRHADDRLGKRGWFKR